MAFPCQVSRRKNSAQADAIIVQNAADVTEMLQKELERLSDRVHSLDEDMRSLLKDNRMLHQEVARLSAENEILKAKINYGKVQENQEEPAARPDPGTGS